MHIQGGCLCGDIRYTLSEPPSAVRMCWCRDCQYWCGGNASVNLIVRRQSLAMHGAPAVHSSTADSGHHMRRSFCGRCGTQVTSEALENLQFLVVRVGTLDEPAGFPPTAVIWTDSAPPWAHINPTLTAFPRQPS